MSKADILCLPEYLRHILEAIERITQYTEDMDEVAFLNDTNTIIEKSGGNTWIRTVETSGGNTKVSCAAKQSSN